MNTPPTQPLIDTSKTLGEHLHIVERAGEAADVARATQASAQAAADEIKKQWLALSERFEHLRARVTGAREAVESGEARVSEERQRYSEMLGATHSTNLHYLERAAQIAARLAAITLMKEGLKEAQDRFEEHRAKTVAFAREHGVAPEKIKELE